MDVYVRGRTSRQRKQAVQFISLSGASVCCCLVAVMWMWGVYEIDLYSLSLTDRQVWWDHFVPIDVACALSVRTHPIAQKRLILYRYRCAALLQVFMLHFDLYNIYHLCALRRKRHRSCYWGGTLTKGTNIHFR